MNRSNPAMVQAGRIIRQVLPAFLVLAGGALILVGYIVYRVTHPAPVPDAVNPSHFLMPSREVSWFSRDGREASGWWIPGSEGAPGILLSPGYGMSRSDVLSLSSSLREYGFNMLVSDQRGSGEPRGASYLGLRETEDMLAAIEFLQNQPGVNKFKLGIWGVDVAARAALKVAAMRPEVRSLAVDSAYEAIPDFVAVKVEEVLGGKSRVLEYACQQIFKLYLFGAAGPDDAAISLDSLADRSILFIQGENRKEMARLTEAIYDGIEPQKEMITLTSARVRLMEGEELKNYDRQVSNFFNLNLRRRSIKP